MFGFNSSGLFKTTICAMLLMMLCVSLPISQAEARCYFRNVQVNVKQKQLPLQLNRTLSAQQLTATAGSPVSSNSIVLGHGGGAMRIMGDLDYDIDGDRSKGYCVRLKAVNITIEITPSIKMANHLRPGTCHYNAVYQHEQFHVQVLHRTAQTAARQMPSIVNTHMQKLHASLSRYTSNAQAINNKLQAEFSRTLSSINQQMGTHMDREQSKIDNPTEYARVQNSCR